MISKMKFFFTFIISLYSLVIVLGQEPGMKNYTTYDGLPSDEVYRCILASDGYMWFATNNGVARYDGDAFKTYDVSDGLTDNTILDLIEDQEGRIWFIDISGRLSFFENDHITQFKYNHVILENKSSVEIPSSGLFIPYSKDEISITFFSSKTLYIKNGECKIYKESLHDSIPISRPENHYCFYKNKLPHDSMLFTIIFDSVPISVKIHKDASWGHVNSNYLYLEFEDRVIYFYNKSAIIIYKDGTHFIRKMGFIPMVAIKSVEKGFWIGTFKSGLVYYPDDHFEIKPQINLLHNQFITSIMYDQNNRGWVSTSFGGVFNIQSLYITNFYEEGTLSNNYITKIVQLDSNSFVSFGRSNKVFLNEGFNSEMEVLELDELNNFMVYHVEKLGESVFIATNESLIEVPVAFFLNPNHPKTNIKRYQINSIKDFLFQDSVLWMGTSHGLYYEDNFLKNRSFKPIEVLKKKKRVVDITAYLDRNGEPQYSYLLMQGIDGLEKYRYHFNSSGTITIQNQVFHEKGHPLVSNDILVREKDGAIFKATKGAGIQIIIDDTVINLNEESGLLSNIVNVLKMPLDSILLVGTNKGLNIIRLSDDKYPRIIMSKFITTKDGLKGNDIHDIICYNNHVFVATNMGSSLINVFKVVKMTDSFSIYITNFTVNGESENIDTLSCTQLAYNENNIQIQFDAIDLHDKKGMKYYYRLLGSDQDEWQRIEKSSILFPQLSSGIYTFQVKAQNSYRYTSNNTASISFSINQVFYERVWFKISYYLFLVFIIGFILYLYFRRKNLDLENRNILDDYQQKSLMRLLNPHFIFNSLNSANSFIINNQKKDATLYVSQIATLIRQVFNNASNNYISISGEIDMLDAYLKLEQRRLQNRFKYIIKMDSGLANLEIPSFMIQIFVENSVWHGLSSREQSGALLTVHFKKLSSHIICEIIDNGIGRKAASKLVADKSNKRAKHGIDVIKQRIELLNNRFVGKPLKLEIIDKINIDRTRVYGTIVRIHFPFF